MQVCVKRLMGRCCLCRESRYECLQAHRVVPGSKYAHGAVVALCATHHALVTAGTIRVLGIRPCSWRPLGVVHWVGEDGAERFTPVPVLGE